MNSRKVIVFLVVLASLTRIVYGETRLLSDAEKTLWKRHLLPLPQEVSFAGETRTAPKALVIRAAADAPDIARSAAADLRAAIPGSTETRSAATTFEIVVGTLDKDGKLEGVPVAAATRLREAPNRDQAYAIEAVGDNKLLLAGVTGKGAFYATRTLRQLSRPLDASGQVVIPLVSVVDWPDFAERGLWNGPAGKLFPELADLKFNFNRVDVWGSFRFERGKGIDMKTDAIREAIRETERRAGTPILTITHLNFLHEFGLFKAYPELAGVGDAALAGRYFAHKEGNQHRAPCASNPLLAKLLAEIMENLGAAGATEISCWLTERPAQCQCANCLRHGQFVQEARAFIAAWRVAREKYPELKIRLFLSTTTTQSNDKILAELPEGVKIERACATGMETVRKDPRDRLSNPLLDAYAKNGLWITSYDIPITSNGKVDTPEVKTPERSACRIRDYLRQLGERRYSGVIGFLAWGNHVRDINGYNIQALAEWAWNRDGRDEREFTLAWATREGFAAPEKVADWAALMGPVEFDVYGSGYPACYAEGGFVRMVREKQYPRLGEGMFRYYRDEQDFDRVIAICDKAMALAKTFKDQSFADETRVIAGYAALAKAIYRVALLNVSSDFRSAAAQKDLANALAELEKAGKENTAALTTWRTRLAPTEPPATWHPRALDAIAATKETTEQILSWMKNRYTF